MALSQRDSSSEALDLERAALSPSRDRLDRLIRAALPGNARNARSSDFERTRNHFSAFSTCTSGNLPSECSAKSCNHKFNFTPRKTACSLHQVSSIRIPRSRSQINLTCRLIIPFRNNAPKAWRQLGVVVVLHSSINVIPQFHQFFFLLQNLCNSQVGGTFPLNHKHHKATFAHPAKYLP